jgi:hypothetical protein
MGKLVHILVDKYEVGYDVAKRNCFIIICVKCVRKREEHERFGHMPKRDTIAWTRMC